VAHQIHDPQDEMGGGSDASVGAFMAGTVSVHQYGWKLRPASRGKAPRP
jgi:hypothetical protein